MIMKKTNFFYAAAIALVSTFGMTSCSVEDNPNPDPTQYVVEQVSLQDIPFYDCEGTYGKDAKKDKTAGFAWALNESTGLPYGDGNVINFADLSEYSKLLVVATEGTPRFLLNRDIENGQWNADESQSHLIEYPKGDDVWSAKYFSVQDVEGGKLYTVDLAQIVKDKGFAHLHAIKGANWANTTVTSMVVEK
jgi:hypothetical protein